jgi:hypothetical protein
MLLNSAEFLASFWADFLAGLTLLLIGSVLIPVYLRFRERPKIRLVSSQTWKNRFLWNNSQDDNWRTVLPLIVQNRGNKTLERFYWEIFIEKGLLDGVESAMKYPGIEWMRTVDIKDYVRVYGYIELPVFPLESIDFPYRIRLKASQRRPVSVYYYFKTDSGQVPSWAWIGDQFNKFFLLKKLYIS